MQEQAFRFDDKRHIYYLGERKLQGVTSVLGIIAKPMLIGWAANMACDYIGEFWAHDKTGSKSEWEKLIAEARKAHTRKKDTASDEGKRIHALIENLVKEAIAINDGKLLMNLTAEPAVQSFCKWAIDNNIKFLESEKRLYSLEWGVGGTADLLFEMNNKKYIGDVKTHKKLWDNVPFIQCAAYAKMLKEMEGVEATGTCVISIPKETQKVEAVFREHIGNDIQSFEAALHLYNAVPLN